MNPPIHTPAPSANKYQPIIAAIIGVVLIAWVLFLAKQDDCHHSANLDVLYRIAISIAVGAFASIIPGSINFKYQKVITASGAIGVFAIVFLYNPATLINKNDNGCIPNLIQGTVYINGKYADGAEVRLFHEHTQSNKSGDFAISCSTIQTVKKFPFRIVYGNLDKKVFVDKDSLDDIEFRFQLDTTIVRAPINPPSKPNGPRKHRSQSNVFSGTLSQSNVVNYGGGIYCNYQMRFLDIKMTLSLTNDRKDVKTSKVTFKAIETANVGCPLPAAAPNTHIYDKGVSSISDNKIYVSFIPDNANNPSCSMSFSGIISDGRIIGTLHCERVNMPDPILVFKLPMDIELR